MGQKGSSSEIHKKAELCIRELHNKKDWEIQLRDIGIIWTESWGNAADSIRPQRHVRSGDGARELIDLQGSLFLLLAVAFAFGLICDRRCCAVDATRFPARHCLFIGQQLCETSHARQVQASAKLANQGLQNMNHECSEYV